MPSSSHFYHASATLHTHEGVVLCIGRFVAALIWIADPKRGYVVHMLSYFCQRSQTTAKYYGYRSHFGSRYQIVTCYSQSFFPISPYLARGPATYLS